MSASWIGNLEKGNEKVKEQEWENITVVALEATLTKSQKLKSPGIDNNPNLWLNGLLSSHVTFGSLLNEIMQNPEKTPERMCEGATYLLAKTMTQKTKKTLPLNFTLPTNHLPFSNLQTSNISFDR